MGAALRGQSRARLRSDARWSIRVRLGLIAMGGEHSGPVRASPSDVQVARGPSEHTHAHADLRRRAPGRRSRRGVRWSEQPGVLSRRGSGTVRLSALHPGCRRAGAVLRVASRPRHSSALRHRGRPTRAARYGHRAARLRSGVLGRRRPRSKAGGAAARAPAPDPLDQGDPGRQRRDAHDGAGRRRALRKVCRPADSRHPRGSRLDRRDGTGPRLVDQRGNRSHGADPVHPRRWARPRQPPRRTRGGRTLGSRQLFPHESPEPPEGPRQGPCLSSRSRGCRTTRGTLALSRVDSVRGCAIE